MILRLIERTDRIAHVPRILYHWRAHPDSTAGGDGQAVRLRGGAQRDRRPPGARRRRRRGRLRAARALSGGPSGRPGARRVDLVLAVERRRRARPTRPPSWLAQPHPTWNVVLAAPGRGARRRDRHAAPPPASPTRHRHHRRPHGSQRCARRRGHAATAEHLLLMQTPAVGLTHDWLTRLLGYSAQPGIAAAGPVILAPDGRIQQAGIAIPDGIPLHLLHGARSSMDELFGYGTSVYNVSAVSGILATPRATYHQLGGLDPTYGELALIDYCLRAGHGPPTHRHRPRRPPAHHRTRPHHQRPARPLATAHQPGPQPTPTTPTTTPTTAPTAATSSPSRGVLTWPSQRSAAPRRACIREPRLRPGERSALASLRSASTPHRRALQWLLHPDGVLGRALSVPRRRHRHVSRCGLAGDVSFSGRAMLLPHDWRDRHWRRPRVGHGDRLRDGRRTRAVVRDAGARQTTRPAPRPRRSSAPSRPRTTALQLSVHATGRARSGRATGRAGDLGGAGAHRPTRLRRSPRQPAGRHPPTPSPAHRHRPDRSSPCSPPSTTRRCAMLEEAIASVRNQTYAHWELCLVDDGSTNPEIIAALERHADSDPRIHLTRHDHRPGHLRRHQRRPGPRHRRLHRPPGPRRHPHPRRPPAHRRPHHRRPHPRHALQRRGRRRRRRVVRAPHQAGLVA